MNNNDQPEPMDLLLQQLEERMNRLTANNAAQLNHLAAQNEARLNQLIATNTELVQKIDRLEAAQAAYPPPAVTATEYTDIVPAYASGNDIQLDAFKVIHEFNGDKKIYRSWRMQVTKMMKQIEAHQTSPKYATALAIVRAKITGPASDVLINNNTVNNIDAIIDRLDFSYADKRPLYIIEAEMMAIKQQSKSLQEFYDAINQGLNMVLTKITMSYKEPEGQKSLIAEAKMKAIRTFITGVNSNLIRNTLYGNMPKSLSEAFGTAQTVQFDNQHLQLENKASDQQKRDKRANQLNPNFNPNFRYQTMQLNQTPKINSNSALQNKPPQPPTPMEVDASGQFTQKAHPSNGFQQQKRQREQSLQYTNKPSTSFKHANNAQRINHVDEIDEISSSDENSMDNNYDTEAIEEQSAALELESVFLEQ